METIVFYSFIAAFFVLALAIWIKALIYKYMPKYEDSIILILIVLFVLGAILAIYGIFGTYINL